MYSKYILNKNKVFLFRPLSIYIMSSINKNCQLYLQNNQTYDSVKGSIYDNKITIQCQNITDQIEVEWLIIGERHVIDDPITDNNGNLKCEHYM